MICRKVHYIYMFYCRAFILCCFAFLEMTSGLVQYVILRTDLKNIGWPLGAVIAQACHGTALCLDKYKDDEYTNMYLADGSGMHKV